jgi:hypothetical protein
MPATACCRAHLKVKDLRVRACKQGRSPSGFPVSQCVPPLPLFLWGFSAVGVFSWLSLNLVLLKLALELYTDSWALDVVVQLIGSATVELGVLVVDILRRCRSKAVLGFTYFGMFGGPSFGLQLCTQRMSTSLFSEGHRRCRSPSWWHSESSPSGDPRTSLVLTDCLYSGL